MTYDCLLEREAWLGGGGAGGAYHGGGGACDAATRHHIYIDVSSFEYQNHEFVYQKLLLVTDRKNERLSPSQTELSEARSFQQCTELISTGGFRVYGL